MQTTCAYAEHVQIHVHMHTVTCNYTCNNYAFKDSTFISDTGTNHLCRVMSCKRLKQQIVSDLVNLRESRDIIQEESEKLEDKMKRLLARNKNLLDRAKRLACYVELRSPVLSEAEDCMSKEVEGVRDHIKTMELAIFNVGTVVTALLQVGCHKISLSFTRAFFGFGI